MQLLDTRGDRVFGCIELRTLRFRHGLAILRRLLQQAGYVAAQRLHTPGDGIQRRSELLALRFRHLPPCARRFLQIGGDVAVQFLDTHGHCVHRRGELRTLFFGHLLPRAVGSIQKVGHVLLQRFHVLSQSIALFSAHRLEIGLISGKKAGRIEADIRHGAGPLVVRT